MSSADSQVDVSSNSQPVESRHQMKMRHKNELKTLLSQNVKGIGAKKQLKEAEKALLAKHEQELKDLDEREKAKEASEEVQAEVGSHTEETDASPPQAQEPKGPSRAQKRREKKSAAEKQRRIDAIESTKDMKDLKGDEIALIQSQLDPLKLKVKEIVSDGHCLYRAIGDQLSQFSLNNLVSSSNLLPAHLSLRHMCAEFMRQNKDDFLPFLTDDQTGDMLDDEGFAEYLSSLSCSKLGPNDEVTWGGHVEIVALASALGRKIVVYSADGKPIVNEPKEKKGEEEIRLTYHRHYYGMGDHYNSVQPWTAEDEEDHEEKKQSS